MAPKRQTGAGNCFGQPKYPSAEELRAKFGKYIPEVNQAQFNRDVDELMQQIAEKQALDLKTSMPSVPGYLAPLPDINKSNTGVATHRAARTKQNKQK